MGLGLGESPISVSRSGKNDIVIYICDDIYRVRV